MNRLIDLDIIWTSLKQIVFRLNKVKFFLKTLRNQIQTCQPVLFCDQIKTIKKLPYGIHAY